MVAAPPPAAALGESTRPRVFLEFTAKVARIDDLVGAGKRSLARFHQELEYFRRPWILKESDIVNEVVKSNCTDRMKSYLQACCSLHSQNISNINQLHSCERELEDHISKVKELLEELRCLVEDTYNTTLTDNLSALKVSDNHDVDSKMNDKFCLMEEKIVRVLSLELSSPEFENYNLMWDLRPYIDDSVMDIAWKMCP